MHNQNKYYSDVAQLAEHNPVKIGGLRSTRSVGVALMATQKCCTCKQDKPLTEFARNRSKKNGFSGQCKQCFNSGNYGKTLQCTQCGSYFTIKHRNISQRKIFKCPPCRLEQMNAATAIRNKARATYKTTHQKGYEYTFCHKRKKYIFSHRMKMEESLGRYLHSNEIIHHIDNDITNNNISNLWLTDSSQHKKAHVSLVSASWDAVKSGAIIFDAELGQYKLRK